MPSLRALGRARALLVALAGCGGLPLNPEQTERPVEVRDETPTPDAPSGLSVDSGESTVQTSEWPNDTTTVRAVFWAHEPRYDVIGSGSITPAREARLTQVLAALDVRAPDRTTRDGTTFYHLLGTGSHADALARETESGSDSDQSVEESGSDSDQSVEDVTFSAAVTPEGVVHHYGLEYTSTDAAPSSTSERRTASSTGGRRGSRNRRGSPTRRTGVRRRARPGDEGGSDRPSLRSAGANPSREDCALVRRAHTGDDGTSVRRARPYGGGRSRDRPLG